ncbi:hypothetical protein PINS_up003075 [Pythium insidiosum]|nr:hypothetical protein PINS_up003075 [Pythium insidiosum]
MTETPTPSSPSPSSPSPSSRPTSAPKSASPKKKAVGWAALLKSQVLQQRQDVPSDGMSLTSTAETERPALPNEAIFNTQFTTAGRKFLSKVKKNRAMQLDRRTKGFQQGQANGTVKIDAITKRHYRLLLVDPDLPRREDLADALEQHFEVLVAATNERALALLAMFKKVDLALLRLSLGNDHSTATSPTLEFLRDARRKQPMLPIALLTPSAVELAQHSDLSKLLGQALQLGACGFFQDDDASLSTVDALIDRLTKLLHSLVLAQRELVQCRRKSKHGRARASGVGGGDDEEEDDDFGGPKVVQAMLRRGTSTLTRRPCDVQARDTHVRQGEDAARAQSQAAAAVPLAAQAAPRDTAGLALGARPRSHGRWRLAARWLWQRRPRCCTARRPPRCLRPVRVR